MLKWLLLMALLAPLFLLLVLCRTFSAVGQRFDLHLLAERICDTGHWIEDQLDPT